MSQAPQQTFFDQLAAKRMYWGVLLIWAVVSYFAGGELSNHMKFRINDLSAIPGAGMVVRDVEGNYFHVNASDQARSLYPVLASGYTTRCIDCVLVTGEKLSETSDFCAAGVKSLLPDINFEKPCRSWAIMDDGHKVVSVTLFLLPVLLWPLLRAVLKVLSGQKPQV